MSHDSSKPTAGGANGSVVASRLASRSRGVVEPALLERFVDTFLYREEALLVDALTRVDAEARALEGLLDTTRPLPLSAAQRTSALHPAHVSAAEILMATGGLGCLHAYLFHGCRWDEGWAGFGNRIHRADWKRLALIGPPLALASRETRTRVGPRRIVVRFEFRFTQAGELVYSGDQSAIFVKDRSLGALSDTNDEATQGPTTGADDAAPAPLATPGHQR